MFIKCNGSLLNANLFSLIRVSRNEIQMFLPSSKNPIITLRYATNELAAYAYGRIIHGLLGKWGCVDASEDVIARLLAEKEDE
jgi:hypothetical protein